MLTKSLENMHDVLIAGAGPAGCLTAIVLARAGARVLLIDRARFPRDKLCGDTVNPGALAILRRMNIGAADRGLPIHGMVVTGPGRVRVAATYPGRASGRALLRRDFDHALVRSAAAAGVEVQEDTLVQRVAVRGHDDIVSGLIVRSHGGKDAIVDGRLVIAADGRGSRLAQALGLSRHPRRPRRWAVGAYFTNVEGLTSHGEMHIRPRHYIGVAPLPDALVNVCVVTAERDRLRRTERLLADCLANDPVLRDRFASAEMVTPPTVLGPLAVDCVAPGRRGLLLAGDAAGFIDPMTGDGLRFALRGAELAAAEALHALESGEVNGHRRLARARRREFAAKSRFNRTLRRLVGTALGVHLAAQVTRACRWPVRRLVTYAGDVQP
jgi:menaquinone-9 beta-reductase